MRLKRNFLDLTADNYQYRQIDLNEHDAEHYMASQPVLSRDMGSSPTMYSACGTLAEGSHRTHDFRGLKNAVFGEEYFTGVIQPLAYRTLEVILRLPWDSAADIWNLGALVRIPDTLLEPCD